MMDKNELLLFIAERLEQITKMSKGQFSGRITREEQTKYQQAWSYIDPKAKVTQPRCNWSKPLPPTAS